MACLGKTIIHYSDILLGLHSYNYLSSRTEKFLSVIIALFNREKSLEA